MRLYNYWETVVLWYVFLRDIFFFFAPPFVTVPYLLVVSTSQLVFSHAWTTGPIQYLTDDRPAISWTCRHEHLSTLQNPPFLSPYFPPGRNPDSHRMSLKQWLTNWDCINRFCYGSSFPITQTRFFSSIPSISDRAVESFPIIGWFLRRTTVSTVFSSGWNWTLHFGRQITVCT